MSRFSEELGYSARRQETIIESAPIWLRIAFFQDVLDYFLDDMLESTTSDFIHVINYSQLINSISITFQRDLDEHIDLLKLFREIEWYEFYDIIEIIGNHIESACDEIVAMEDISFDKYPIQYSRYINQVNKFFEGNNVRWRLDDDSKLHLLLPDELIKMRRKVGTQLIESGLKTTRTHFQKSEDLFTRRPLDPANSIKEIVSALEALGTTLYPDVEKLTATKMIKELKKEDLFPDYFLQIMQIFYGYASSEPGVRHGIELPILVGLADAEFCFHFGTALMQYIMSVKKSV